MRLRPGLSLALWTLACGLASAQVESGRSAESAAGGAPAASGASLDAPPAAVSLSVAALSAVPLAAAPAPFAPASLAAAPAAVAAAGPASETLMAPALAAPAELPPASVPNGAGGAVIAPARAIAPSADGEGAGDSADDDAGRGLFDAAAPVKKDGGLWTALKGWAGLGDRVPAWPGKAGDRVRLGGRTLALGRSLPGNGDARLWTTERGEYVAKLVPRDRGEAAALRALRDSDIPHSRLVAASADGRVLVKEFLLGDDAAALLPRGFEDRHAQGWAELAAKLIRAGVSADLSPKNLIWQHWRTRWALADASGAAPAGPGKVLERLLTPQARAAGVEPGAFLSGLRGRLGPDSPAWAKTLAALRADPALALDLAALESRDRALPAPPEIVFGPAPERSAFPDTAGPPSDAAKALGYDPLTASPRRLLHTDDPGKLNTEVFSVEPPGKTPVVVKIAEWGIVRRELALRRVIRRWFGRYFDTPSAFGVHAGRGSYLVMELAKGGGAYGQNPLTREQRAALAVLVHAFGVGDVNPGNILFPRDGKPVLIDFEQALSRRTPVAGRLPDEGIALEMPWMSRFEPNRAEDYQPAARAWRALLARPATAAALESDFRAAGYSPQEAAALIEVVRKNSADLDWTIQNDADFVNQFVRRR